MTNDLHTIEPIKVGLLEAEQTQTAGINISRQFGQGSKAPYLGDYIAAQVLAIKEEHSASDNLSYYFKALKIVLNLTLENNNLPIVVNLAFPENFSRYENDEIYRASLAEVELVLEQLLLEQSVVKKAKIVNIQLESPDESSLKFSESYMSRLRTKFKDILQENAGISSAHKVAPMESLLTQDPTPNISKSNAFGLASNVDNAFVEPDSDAVFTDSKKNQPEYGSLEWRSRFGGRSTGKGGTGPALSS